MAGAERRCAWCLGDALYERYHDEEWGRPVADERRLYEKLCLEGFQAGLSWITILRKREAFRAAFAEFDPARVARFDERDVARLLGDAGIVRHRGKIEATILNAQALEAMHARGESLARLAWSREPSAAERPPRIDQATLCTLVATPASTALSRDLRRLGFRFVGPTTCYAFMQAMGIVNDHLEGCPQRAEVERLRRAFARPG